MMGKIKMAEVRMYLYESLVSEVQRTEELYVGDIPVNVLSESSSYWRMGMTLQRGKSNFCYTHIRSYTHIRGLGKTCYSLDLPAGGQGELGDRLSTRSGEWNQEPHANQREHGCCTSILLLSLLSTFTLGSIPFIWESN